MPRDIGTFLSVSVRVFPETVDMWNSNALNMGGTIQ
jgi:hypothetical protein